MSENTGMYIYIHEDFERVCNKADCFLRKAYNLYCLFVMPWGTCPVATICSAAELQCPF